MQGFKGSSKSSRRILRRRSWVVMNWLAIVTLWGMYSLALSVFLDGENYSDVFFLAAAIAAVTALVRRICSCRVVLRAGEIAVENPVFTFRVPSGIVQSVETSPSGGVTIQTPCESVEVFAFGGSLVDYIFGTREKAASAMRERLRSGRKRGSGEQMSTTTRHVRHCWSADILLILAAACASAGAVVKLG
ncbi:hypothetical protein [Streptomyces sp. NPDC008125]|uniref:hypothetical protein n=1 Tax=Streptomyces sp. NPDC008125 TaxID=3364811 RepID=UPI0036EE3158